MSKIWKPFPGECIHCGGAAEVFTDCLVDGCAFDGDVVRCVDCGCPGSIVVSGGETELEDGEFVDSAYVEWHEEPGCKCDWCLNAPIG
jgi:hypothetical protein